MDINNEENKCLIYIPKDGNYIEILGYKIDGFDSFEKFCEHLKRYTELEEEMKITRAYIHSKGLEWDLLSYYQKFRSINND